MVHKIFTKTSSGGAVRHARLETLARGNKPTIKS